MEINKNSFKRFIFSKKYLIPNIFVYLYKIYTLSIWVKRDLLSPFKTPTFVKQKILLKHSLKNSTWIETGTYIGATTGFLARKFPSVHTIEPSDDCLKIAKSNLAGLNNIIYHHGTSEQKLEKFFQIYQEIYAYG